MSVQDSGPGRPGVKTIAIRLESDLHAQLSLIAQLRGSTITDEIRQAIETHVSSIKASPELAGKAEGLLSEIEREAIARREAIAALFGTTEPTTPPSRSTTRGRKTRREEASED
ncbi:MAG: hypothetical protein ACRDU4_22155 [Mycobacterium sp.]